MALSEERLAEMRARWDGETNSPYTPNSGYELWLDFHDVLAEVTRLRAVEKRVNPILADVATMGRDGWWYHDTHGWFCPFGCQIYLKEGAEKTVVLLDRTETPAHREKCGYVLAKQWREEAKG